MNAPLARWPGSDTLSAASPAVLVTVAVLVAVYSCSTPGVKAPKLALAPSCRLSVAGTVPPTGAAAVAGWVTRIVSVVSVCAMSSIRTPSGVISVRGPLSCSVAMSRSRHAEVCAEPGEGSMIRIGPWPERSGELIEYVSGPVLQAWASSPSRRRDSIA